MLCSSAELAQSHVPARPLALSCWYWISHVAVVVARDLHSERKRAWCDRCGRLRFLAALRKFFLILQSDKRWLRPRRSSSSSRSQNCDVRGSSRRCNNVPCTAQAQRNCGSRTKHRALTPRQWNQSSFSHASDERQANSLPKKGDLKGLETELKKGVSVDLPGVSGLTPLMWAANNGHIDACKFLRQGRKLGGP